MEHERYMRPRVGGCHKESAYRDPPALIGPRLPPIPAWLSLPSNKQRQLERRPQLHSHHRLPSETRRFAHKQRRTRA
ncbi:hypothetical protein VTH06DRAFT_741 [Thermothelomyces fergusii]